MSESDTMNVYRADVNAIYHIAAPSLGEAFAALWKCWGDEGSRDEIDEYESVVIERLEEKHWPKTYNDDGEGDPHASFPALVARTTAAQVLTCSEWP